MARVIPEHRLIIAGVVRTNKKQLFFGAEIERFYLYGPKNVFPNIVDSFPEFLDPKNGRVQVFGKNARGDLYVELSWAGLWHVMPWCANELHNDHATACHDLHNAYAMACHNSAMACQHLEKFMCKMAMP